VVNSRQTQYFHFPGAVRYLDFYGIAYAPAKQTFPDGRTRRNLSIGDVCFFTSYQVEGTFLVLAQVKDDNLGAKTDAVTRDSGEIDHGKLPEPRLKVPQAGVDPSRALLGCMVFGILAEI